MYSFDLSALILPVSIPQEEFLSIRKKYTVDGKRGLMPHISLVYPFIRNFEDYEAIKTQLRRMFDNEPPFTVTFTSVETESGKGLIFLKPSPNPTIENLITRCYQLLPQEAPAPFPHLTLAKTRNTEKLADIARKHHRTLNALIPFTTVISQALFCTESHGEWQVCDILPFSTDTSAY